MNKETARLTATSYSPFQKKKQQGHSPDKHVLANADKQIMKAVGLLANVLRSARRQADEETVSEARKTELEDWIERNEAEIDARIEKLGALVGLGLDPEKDEELRDLLKGTVVPP